MDFVEFKDWMTLGLLSGGVYVLYSLKASVEELNTRVAVIIEKISHHERRIEHLEDRL
jgi:hypothetical protein